MSGLYLPCVEMPTTGHITVIEINCIGGVRINGKTIENKAVAVPEHGDLIDKSGVEVMSWTDGEYGTDFEDGVLYVMDKLDELPVVIPADPPKEVTE